MLGQGGKARDLLRPTSNHLHRSGQEVIKLPHMLSIISQRAFRTLFELHESSREDTMNTGFYINLFEDNDT